MNAKNQWIKWCKAHPLIFEIAGTILLVLFAFLHVNRGVEWTDTGYSLGNYRNFPQSSGTWVLATFLANFTGWLLGNLPFGETMLGMQVYCNLLLAVFSVAMFWILKKTFSGPAAFLGIAFSIALCWCPRVILYNYLTYYLFAIAAVLVIRGLIKNQNILLYIAGILLGLNLFVRFPNVTECMLIVVVIFHNIISKKTVKEGFKQVFLCIVGYFTSFLAMMAILSVRYGFREYFLMIRSLFAMKETASSYSPVQMVIDIASAYASQAKWWLPIAMVIALGFVIFLFVKKPVIKYICSGIYICLLLGSILILYKLPVFWRNYNDFFSVNFWVVGFLIFSLVLSAYVMCSKNDSVEKRLFAVTAIVVILVTPLGSNNALYPVYNNLFLIAPFVFDAGLSFLKQKEDKMWPLQLAAFFLTLILCVQCFLFGITYTFRDNGFPDKTNTLITKNYVLRGMKTNPDTKKQIEELSEFAYTHGYKGRGVILFGHIPSVAYYLEMHSVLSSAWADLDTVLNYEGMSREMSALQECVPVIVNAENYPDLLKLQNETNSKEQLLMDYINVNDYTEVFRNERFVVYDRMEMKE